MGISKDNSYFERSIPSFFGGNRFRSLVSGEFMQLAAEFFDTLLYKYIRPTRPKVSIDKEYTTNQDFWQDILGGLHFQGMRVQLNGFHLSEWIPSTPGRYFAGNTNLDYVKSYVEAGAIYSDYILTDVYNDQDGILLPYEKVAHVMLYGIGSLRLRAKVIDDQRMYFLGASSTGISHQGIPIALLEENYKKIIGTIKLNGGVFSNIVGTLQLLPMSMSPIQFPNKVPRYCIFLDDVDAIKPSSSKDLLITIACMYSGDRKSQKSWTFCSFNPDSGENNIHAAVDWLRGYAIRFSGSPEPSIFGNFDEYYDHFGYPTEFSIKDLFEGNIDVSLLRQYGNGYGLNINVGNVVMGDLFNNIENSKIVNRSTVINSFNSLNKSLGQEIAVALVRVAEEISITGNEEAGELFESFNKELQKSPRNFPVLKALWHGIIKTVPILAQVEEISTPIKELLIKL